MSIALDVRETRQRAQAAPLVRRLAALWFWIKRYAPPELAGTATMVAGGLIAAAAGAPVWIVGIAGALAESIGFYSVAAIAVWREQRRAFPERGRLRILIRVAGLLLLEFGPAELLDTLFVRPVALAVGVALIPNIAWGLLAGKIVADAAFYILAAVAFRVSEKSGIRGAAQ